MLKGEEKRISFHRAESYPHFKFSPSASYSSKVDWCNETVDLTGCDDCKEQKQNDSKGTEKEPFIALEDTTSAFIESFFWNSLLRGCSGEAR